MRRSAPLAVILGLVVTVIGLSVAHVLHPQGMASRYGDASHNLLASSVCTDDVFDCGNGVSEPRDPQKNCAFKPCPGQATGDVEITTNCPVVSETAGNLLDCTVTAKNVSTKTLSTLHLIATTDATNAFVQKSISCWNDTSPYDGTHVTCGEGGVQGDTGFTLSPNQSASFELAYKKENTCTHTVTFSVNGKTSPLSAVSTFGVKTISLNPSPCTATSSAATTTAAATVVSSAPSVATGNAVTASSVAGDSTPPADDPAASSVGTETGGCGDGRVERMTTPDATRRTQGELMSYLDSLSAAQNADGSSVLDVDDNGTVDEKTDGILIIRYILSFTGDPLVVGAVGDNAKRTEPADIEAYLATHLGDFDIDGNGKTDAFTDGILILRYMLGYTGRDLAGEDCDDGNTKGGDGCDDECVMEPGWLCSTDSPSKCTKLDSSPGATCGNGHIESLFPQTSPRHLVRDIESHLQNISSVKGADGFLPLDIDNDGHATPLTDGIMLLRYELGWRGLDLTTGALSATARRTNYNDILAFLRQHASQYDINADGHLDVSTDGLLVLRYLFGFNGLYLYGEDCDQGANHTNGDGCSADCRTEAGWTCTGEPSLCTATDPNTADLAIDVTGPSSISQCSSTGAIVGIYTIQVQNLSEHDVPNVHVSLHPNAAFSLSTFAGADCHMTNPGSASATVDCVFATLAHDSNTLFNATLAFTTAACNKQLSVQGTISASAFTDPLPENNASGSYSGIICTNCNDPAFACQTGKCSAYLAATCLATPTECTSGQQLVCDVACGTSLCSGQCCRCTNIAGTSSVGIDTTDTSSTSGSTVVSSSTSSYCPVCLAALCSFFCKANASTRECHEICQDLPTDMNPDSYLCNTNERLTSFTCDFSLQTPACTYSCAVAP